MNLAKDRCGCNILHICDYHKDEFGEYESPDAFLDYPGHIVNSSLVFNGKKMTATELSKLFGRPFMGGIERVGAIATGTEADAREVARAALHEKSERYMLAADCTVPGDTPWENLRAAIEEAHGS
jgi:uroporphyrinogen decarboxylase